MRTNTGVDQNSFYTLEYDNGKTAQLSAGFKMSGPTQAIIMGSKGSITIPFFLGAKEYELCVEGKPAQSHVYDFPSQNNFTFEIQHVTDCIQAKQTQNSMMPSTATLRVMTIMDTIRQQWGLTYPNEL